MRHQSQQVIQQVTHIFFLFINSNSGQGEGRKIIQQNIGNVQFLIPNPNKLQIIMFMHVYFVHLNNQQHKQKGFKKLQQQIKVQINSIYNQLKKIYVISCGGDGTNGWLVQQLFNHNIDFNKFVFSNLPLGTGNDFSQYYGFNKQESKITNKSYKKLKQLLIQWSQAQQQMLDVWTIKANTFQNGFFQVIESNQRKSIKLKQKIFQKIFIEYFSFGIDGKVGYSFDKYRGQSRVRNLFLYTVMGIAKNFTSTKNINQLITSMSMIMQKPKGFITFPYQSQMKLLNNIKSIQSTLINPRTKIKKIFQIQSLQINQQKNLMQRQNIQQEKIQIILNKKYSSIVVLNINSFMAGYKNIWHNSKDVYGHGRIKWKNQSSNDGELQFIGFKSLIGQALQNTIHGLGQKLCQNKGPFLIQFRHNSNPKHRTYLQIDGQFVRFTHPKNILIKKWNGGINGQVRVLRKKA